MPSKMHYRQPVNVEKYIYYISALIFNTETIETTPAKYGYRAIYLLFTLILALIVAGGCNRPPVKVVPVAVVTVDDIADLDSSLVIPYDYQNVISLEDLPVEEKKKKFIDLLLPAVLVAKERFSHDLQRIEAITKEDMEDWNRRERAFIEEKMKYFDAENIGQLKLRLRTHPNSIIIAQAALESGWGTSRFFLEANNVFGVHSFDVSHDRIEAGRHRNGDTSYLKRYGSLSESVEDYLRTIARGPYKDFRIHRAQTDDPYKLIAYLDNYSILGDGYIYLLEEVIRANDLTQYDHYFLRR